MKVILVGIYDTNTVSLAPNLLAGYARRFPIATKYQLSTMEFSLFNDSPSHIASAINRHQPDIVGFSCYIWNIDIVCEIAPNLRATIILGGPQVTDIEQGLLARNPAVDIIVTGEGEIVFVELLRYFAGERDLETIPQLALRNPPRKNPPAGELLDLSQLPEIYREIFTNHPAITWISFGTSRGCPMACRYCTWGYSKKMRYLPLERVLDQLDLILAHESLESVYFTDSSILLNKRRAKAILRHIIAAKANKTIRFEFSYEQLDDEIIDLMAKLPNMEFNLGLQSINPAALESVGRRFKQTLFEKRYRKIVALGGASSLTIDLIYGLPGDDYVGYKSSLEYAIALGTTERILTNPLIILPGSEYFRTMEQYGIKLRDDHSYLMEESASFSKADMARARKLSFMVSICYFNHGLRDAMRLLAETTRRPYTDTILGFFESLPFQLAGDDDYPDMVPSSRADFIKRNAVLKLVVENFARIIDHLRTISHHALDEVIGDYQRKFSNQYKRIAKLYIASTAE